MKLKLALGLSLLVLLSLPLFFEKYISIGTSGKIYTFTHFMDLPAVYQDRTRSGDSHHSLLKIYQTPGTLRYRLVRPGGEVKLCYKSSGFSVL